MHVTWVRRLRYNSRSCKQCFVTARSPSSVRALLNPPLMSSASRFDPMCSRTCMGKTHGMTDEKWKVLAANPQYMTADGQKKSSLARLKPQRKIKVKEGRKSSHRGWHTTTVADRMTHHHQGWHTTTVADRMTHHHRGWHTTTVADRMTHHYCGWQDDMPPLRLTGWHTTTEADTPSLWLAGWHTTTARLLRLLVRGTGNEKKDQVPTHSQPVVNIT